MSKRVVVTGLGAITPIGNNVEEFWNSLKEKKVLPVCGNRGKRSSHRRGN